MTNDKLLKAFNVFKTSQLIVKVPDVHGKFILRTDATNKWLYAVLLQDEARYILFEYANKKLLLPKKNLSTFEKECFAWVWAVERF